MSEKLETIAASLKKALNCLRDTEKEKIVLGEINEIRSDIESALVYSVAPWSEKINDLRQEVRPFRQRFSEAWKAFSSSFIDQAHQ